MASPLSKDLIAGQDLASDRFISYSTWKWLDLATRTGGKPTYYYLYARARPAMRAEMGNATAGLAGGVAPGPAAAANQRPKPRGAVHSEGINGWKSMKLKIDLRALGLDAGKVSLRAPTIKGYQPETELKPGEPLTVAAKRGWLLVLQ